MEENNNKKANDQTSELPGVPEQIVSEPETSRDDLDSIIPIISDITGISVSEIESKPIDIQELLAIHYTNNADLPKSELRQELTSIIAPNSIVGEQNIQKKDQREDEPYISTQKPDKHDLMKEKDNPLLNTEVGIEGSYSFIDGVINNVPPQDLHEKEEKHEPATMSMSMLFAAAAISDSVQRESENREQGRKPPDHGSL